MLILRKNMATRSIESRMYLTFTLTLFIFASVNSQTSSTQEEGWDEDGAFGSPYQGILPQSDLEEQPAAVDSSNTKAPSSAEDIISTQAAVDMTTSSPANVADFIIRDDNGKACIRACFSAVLNVFYTNKQEENAQVKVPLPSKATAIGTCGSVNGQAELTIQWNEGRYELKFLFENKTENGKESWTAQILQFTYNTSDDRYFKNAAGAGMKTVRSEEDEDELFKTAAPKSRKCESEDGIQLVGRGNNTADKAVLELRQLQLQPYNLFNDSFSKAELCKNDKEAEGTNIASIAVGATLALVILIVIAGYAIGRRMGAITDKTSYSSME